MESDSLLQNEAPKAGKLKQNTLGLAHVLAMSIAGICPTTSIFFVTGQIASQAGASAPFVLILASIVCLLFGWTIKEFSRFVSTAGSFYSFITVGLGPHVGFISGWLMVAGYGILSIETLLQFGCWFSDVFSRNTGFTLHWGFCALFVAIIVVVFAVLGINPALKLSLVLAVLEAIVMFALATKIVVSGGPEGNYPLALTPFNPYNGGTTGILRGLVFAMLVFIGFEQAAVLGEETKNPQRNIGIAVTASIGITLFYMTYGMYAMIIGQGPSQAFQLVAIASPADEFARRFIGNWFAWFVDIAGVTATYNVAQASMNNMFRILFSIGREGVLGLNSCGYTGKRQTPTFAILTFTSFAAVAALAFGLGSPPQLDLGTQGCWAAYAYTSFAGTLPLIVVFLITNPALTVYMWRKQRVHFRVWRHVIPPAICTLLLFVPLIGNFWPEPVEPPKNIFVFILLGWLALGVIVVAIMTRYPAQLARIGAAFASSSTPGADSESEGQTVPVKDYSAIQ
eukprot:TRINITY_DN8125_c0_g1_i1.p1 TRINITY_DN8125_c0_g1~~TRINITY_DN8125_c0_g1_i1.p1  ORF type:complete len:511 (+),score=62.22 TRINITY_DN8125_c0_g1_i1:126-1658(+)